MSQFSGCVYGANNDDPDAKTFYLSSLAVEVNDNHISDYFSAFGEVQSVQTRKQRSNSVDFVTFTQADSVAKALAEEYHTIAGQRGRIGIADTRGEPLESGNKATGTHLLDLNDDCFYEILSLKSISVIELCSMARTSSRLRNIAREMFTKRFKNINLKSSVKTIQEARIVLGTFGSLISELSLSSHLGPAIRTGIFDLVAKCCTNLESLCLYNCDVPECVTVKLKPSFSNLRKLRMSYCTIKGDSMVLFDNCASLVEIDVTDVDMRFIFDNTFPQLTTFRFNNRVDLSLGNFISRHKNLKSLSIRSYDDCSFLLPIIAFSCKQLEELSVESESGSSVRYDQAFKKILILERLNKLSIGFNDRNFTLTQGLGALKSLKHLEFRNVGVDPELFLALSQLKTLEVLRLSFWNNKHYVKNMNPINELVQLKELSITISVVGLYSSTIVDLNVAFLIERLTKLKSLQIFTREFKLDKKNFLKILEVLRKRVISPEHYLELTCYVADNIIDDLEKDDRQLIKLTKWSG